VIIFDSWALLAFFQNEPEGIQVEEIIRNEVSTSSEMYISVINLGEIWYSVAKKFNDKKADEVIDYIETLGIKVVPIEWPLTQIASKFKKRGGLSYADCFAAALTFEKKGTLLTGDFEFEKLSDLISIHPLRSR
jgi:predicted nucleic acid-binding protein